MKKLISIWCALILAGVAFGQNQNTQKISLPAYGVTKLEVSVHWGEINIEPGASNSSIDIFTQYENAKQKDLALGPSRLMTKVQGQSLMIASPKPQSGTFESYNLTIRVPVSMELKLEMKRGGEISVKGIKGSIEIDNQNGSTLVEEAASWLTVNNFNGEIKVSFHDLRAAKAISLITFNGGITLSTPAPLHADVVLQTKKNGWIRADFPVVSADGRQYVNMHRDYEASGNQWHGRIGEGGTKIIAISNNGPVEILKRPR